MFSNNLINPCNETEVKNKRLPFILILVLFSRHSTEIMARVDINIQQNAEAFKRIYKVNKNIQTYVQTCYKLKEVNTCKQLATFHKSCKDNGDKVKKAARDRFNTRLRIRTRKMMRLQDNYASRVLIKL